MRLVLQQLCACKLADGVCRDCVYMCVRARGTAVSWTQKQNRNIQAFSVTPARASPVQVGFTNVYIVDECVSLYCCCYSKLHAFSHLDEVQDVSAAELLLFLRAEAVHCIIRHCFAGSSSPPLRYDQIIYARFHFREHCAKYVMGDVLEKRRKQERERERV